ncbi:hypothetical protein [Synechococcus elongatus]|uniref:hypothetical protein n=1 Tax=Synechococcus elongatus TaxID=32046 RepID=UPI000039FF9C|nr:hypothetical protein [Synechococcus elongatus]AJD58912.1 hypothetical protein M744_12350 [Synechococcus elongatus UTEX 2973]MBD2588782.1 hypothetical protein [Synechococcus elongatus FACHB-242]MBD2689630.1 hypothetical protein [Synechococcus elongatus FACHB-1061]MBD2708236.1 hypothetical protein [Synechococcus elongatus PCC 7942 = FACHB-805]UOW70680.1 hypothetical protein PCC7943_0919 [Synechococcus elongatus PCC 7943]
MSNATPVCWRSLEDQAKAHDRSIVCWRSTPTDAASKLDVALAGHPYREAGELKSSESDAIEARSPSVEA